MVRAGSGKRPAPQVGAGPKPTNAGLKVSQTRNRANPPSHLRRFKRPRAAPPPRCPSAARPSWKGDPRLGPGGADPPQPAPPAWAADLGATAPRAAPRALWEGPAPEAAIAHLRARPASARGSGGTERPSGTPRADSLRHRPQTLAAEACFQIASSSRGRVSFRRPETRAPPPPRRTHVTAARSRAQPGRRERERQAPPLGEGGLRRKPPELQEGKRGGLKTRGPSVTGLGDTVPDN
ncbi:translation initiation factor IF-2-like [Elephas maximus indicus]|uniref:translation initiation factor IF-2-like n=1 Tax=Elephas maximus indicus TaxID=99487 RepID=UPI002116D595|nr:translation initiation factor IF-2-like [Elephas maximus indicus]